MYEDFFGLDDEPFRLTPDPRYLFLSAKHAEALAHLRLGLTESSGFVCITGEVGSGKTTLLRSFLSEIGPNVAVACIYVPPTSRLELLRSVCREFGLPVSAENPTALIDQLNDYLIAEHANGRTCVLVLDEAQALSADLLEQVRLLLNLETATRKLLRIVLIGQPQLRRALLDPGLAQLNQRITLRWHLAPLSRREAADYVVHRMDVASGGRGRRVFTRPALQLLYSLSNGVPRVLNMVAHRALLAAFVSREAQVRRGLVARAYRELQSVPLPGTLSVARKAGWAAAGLAVGVLLFTYGAGPLERLLAGPTSPRPPGIVADARAVQPQPAWQTDLQPEAAQASAKKALPERDPAPPRPTESAELVQSLTRVDSATGAIAAMEAILAAWGEKVRAGELRSPEDRDAVAWRRGLHELALTGNASMLRLLDLPALVAFRVPGSDSPRYAAVTGMDSSRVTLSVAGEPLVVDADLFASHWSGEARVFWRDYEHLGPLLRRDSRGISVARLQRLLSDSGHFHGPATGRFEAGTEQAVQAFQRAHFLQPDGRVGPLTQIVLYAAAGKGERPSLGAKARADS